MINLRDARITDGLPRIVAEQPWAQVLSAVYGELQDRMFEYEDVEVEGEAENATMTEAVEGETEAAEGTTAEDTTHKTHIERKAKPLNTDDVTLRLWSIEDFDIL